MAKESNGCAEKEMKSGKEMAAAPVDKDIDGGWAWVVFVATLLNTTISFGMMISGPIFYVIFLEEFKGSQSYTAWILAAQSAAFSAGGPVSSYLLSKISARTLIVSGGLLYGTCLSLCYVANSIPFLILTFTIAGVSIGFIHQGNVEAITTYFHKKAFAMVGLMYCGAGFGGMIFNVEVEWAVDTFGWRGAMLIQGALVMHICVGGALVFKKPPRSQGNASGKAPPSKPTLETFLSYVNDIRLWLIIVSMLMMNMTLSTMMALFKNIIIHLGFKDYFLYAMMAYGVGGTLGRGGVGLFAQKVSPPMTAFITSVLGATSNALFLTATQPWILLTIVFAFGLFLGANSVVMILQMGWVYGSQKMATISGYIFIFCIITTMTGSPVAGYTADVTGSYNIAIIMCSSCCAVNGVASLMLYWVHQRRQSKQAPDVIASPQQSSP